MLSRSALLASALAAYASAQTASTTVSQSMPPAATAAFNPGNVTMSDAELWCHAQQNTCPQICGSTLGGFASSNTCDDTAFTYSCICNNGTEPDCTAYTQTLPYFICQATFSQCINNHPNDAQGQANCAAAEQCGTLNATALEAVASGGSSSTTSTSMPISTKPSSTAGAAGSATSSGAAAATSSGAAVATHHLSTGAFAAILLAAFKLFV